MNFQDVIREVYDGDNKVLKTSATVNSNSTVFIGTPTLYAVVNTGAAGDPKTYIGLVTATLDNSRGIGVVGNLTLSDSKTYIGLTTTTLGVSDRFIGLTTSVNSQAWPDPKTYIGLNTVTNGAGDRFMGLVTAWVSGVAGNMTLSDAKTYVGLTTTTLGVGTQFIGLVTALSRNAGSAKTLVPVPFAFGASVATIAVPTNANVMYITNMILSANATTQVRMKSGATYMTGNASIGISLNPNGGYVLTGAPDSPSWIGCPSGAIVIEKNDATTLVGGHLIYFQE